MKLIDRNLACKTCGTKVFRSPEEVDDHHQNTHPDVPSRPGQNHIEVASDEENRPAGEGGEEAS